MKTKMICGMALFLGSFATPARAAVTASLVPSRTSGAAPLSVFFDATGTSATGVTPELAFRDLSFTWDFGDPGSGLWPQGASGSWSKNIERGGVAGHVFASAGDHVVTLTVRSPSGEVSTSQVTITVTPADAQWAGMDTTCVCDTGDFDGCPSGATQVVSPDFDASLAQYDGMDRRVLFCRDGSFASDAPVTQNFGGPFMLGAYGEGAKPVVDVAGSVIRLGTGMTDSRYTDIDFRGPAAAASRIIGCEAQTSHVLISGLVGSAFHNAVQFAGGSVHSYAAIVDNDFRDFGYGSGGQLMMLVVDGLHVAGNHADDSTGGEQLVRVSFGHRAHISHNYMANAAPTKNTLDMRCEIYPFTCQYWHVSDNHFAGGPHAWDVALGNGSSSHTDQAEHLVIEGNWFTADTPETQTHLVTFADYVDVRNNLFEMTGAVGIGVNFSRFGAEGPHVDNRAINNTCYSADPSGSNTCARIGSADIRDWTLLNNLIVNDGGATGYGARDGVTNAIVPGNFVLTAAQADLATTPPTLPRHFALTTTSECIDDGTPHLAAIGDWLGNQRIWDGDGTGGAAIDCGAFEYGSEPYGPGGPPDRTPPATPWGLRVR